MLFENSYSFFVCAGSAYLNVQYWAVSAGCFSVLLFIYRMLQQSPKNTYLHLWNSKASKCSLLYLASYTLMSYLSFAMKSYRGQYQTHLFLQRGRGCCVIISVVSCPSVSSLTIGLLFIKRN